MLEAAFNDDVIFRIHVNNVINIEPSYKKTRYHVGQMMKNVKVGIRYESEAPYTNMYDNELQTHVYINVACSLLSMIWCIYSYIRTRLQPKSD